MVTKPSQPTLEEMQAYWSKRQLELRVETVAETVPRPARPPKGDMPYYGPSIGEPIKNYAINDPSRQYVKKPTIH